MTNKKGTKRALLSSVLALLLCMSMLIGTTFAWFTDSVTSGINNIVAGNLDIELDYWNGEDWDSVEGEDQLFTGNLWEPGHTEVVYLRLTNAGTLALKWQLGINIANEVGSISVETNKEFKLSDFIQFSVVENVNGETAKWDRETAIAEAAKVVDGNKKLNEGYADNGFMLAGDKPLHMAVVVYMPETVGNEANYKTGAAVPTIDLGINLVATQYTAEEDSFDELYDEGANATKNIDGIIYLYDGKDVILYHVTPEYKEDTVVVPEGVTVLGNGSFGASASSTVKTVILSSTVKSIGTAFAKNTNIETVVLNEGLTEIPEKAFNQTTALKSVNIPSTVTTIGMNAFRMIAVETLVVPATVTDIGEGAFRDIKAETVIIEGSPVIANYAFRSCPNLKTVIIKGENTTFTGTSQVFTNFDSGEYHIDVYVPNEEVKTGLLDASTNDDKLNIVVAAEEEEGVVKTSDNTHVVYSVEGLQNLHSILKDWTPETAQKVSLVADLDMTGETWLPLSKMFVQFNGNGHTISNLNIVENGYTAGFFGYLGGGYIKDLTLENVTVTGSQAGIFAGQSEGGDIINCTIAGTNVVAWDNDSGNSTGNGVGAFVGVSVSYGSANEISGTIAEGAVITLKGVDKEHAWATTDPYYGGFFTADYETLTPIVNVTNNGTIAECVTTAEDLKAALAAGVTNVYIAGNITLAESLSANNVTFVGVNSDAAINFAGYNITGNGSSTITYKDLTLTTISLPYGGEGVGERYGWYGGIDYARHATANYENCTISGVFTLYSNTVNVKGCTFLPYVQDGTTFNQIFQYGTQTANIEDCTFYYGNRAIKIYNEGGTKDLVMNVTNCTFKADESFDADYDDNKSLISIDASYVTSVKLTVKGVKIDDALNNIALHNGDGNDKITVTIE